MRQATVEKLVLTYDKLYKINKILKARGDAEPVRKEVKAQLKRLGAIIEPYLEFADEGG